MPCDITFVHSIPAGLGRPCVSGADEEKSLRIVLLSFYFSLRLTLLMSGIATEISAVWCLVEKVSACKLLHPSSFLVCETIGKQLFFSLLKTEIFYSCVPHNNTWLEPRDEQQDQGCLLCNYCVIWLGASQVKWGYGNEQRIQNCWESILCLHSLHWL